MRNVLLIGSLIGAGVIVILAGAAYVTVHTSAFNRFALQEVVEEARRAAGSPVEIRSMEIHWSRLGVDLYGIVIQGQGDTQPPFLRADHLEVGLKIISILRRKVDLRELVIDRPALNLRVNAQGQTNLPKPASRNSSSSSPVNTLFDLAIGHLVINSGEFHYNDRAVPVSVDLRGFQVDASYGPLAGTYRGSLAYNHGQVSVRDFNPIGHDARMNFTVSRSQLDFDPLTVVAGETRVTARGKLANYESPNVQFTYESSVSTPQLARILKISELPAGQVAVTGFARYQYAAEQPFLRSILANGQISAPRLGVQIERASTEARAVKGSFALEKGNLHVAALEAGLLQGHLRAKGDVLDLAGHTSTRLTASLNEISLEAVNQALPPGSYDRLHFAGNVNIDAEASWPSRIDDVVAHARVLIVSPTKPLDAESIPLNGMLDIRYDGPHKTVDFAQSHLQTGSTQVSLVGRVSKQSNLAVQANTTDLREVTALVSEIGAATSTSSRPATPSAPLDVQGEAHFSGQVSGAAKDPKLQGQLAASNVEVEGSRWQSIRSNVQLASSNIALQNGTLLSAARGRLTFSGSVGLSNWSVTPASPISLQSTATNLSVTALEHLAKEHYPVDGTLAGNITVQGTRQNPSGHGSIQITKATAWGQPVTNLSGNFEAKGTAIKSTAELQLPAGNILANVTFSPVTGQYDAIVDTSGLKLDQLHAVQSRDLGVGGLLTVSMRGQGTVSNPQLSANLRIAQFHFRGQSISSAEGAINLAGQRANFTLHSAIAQGDVDAKGDVQLAGDYNGNATLDVREVPVGALIASYIPGAPPNLTGQTEVHATVSGPLRNPALMQAHVEIPTFNLAYQSVNIALARPLRLDYRQGIATLEQTELKGTGTDLTLQGVIPVKGSSTAFNITANGGIDLSLLQGFTHGIKSSGRIELQVAGRGNFTNPAMQGQVKIENAYFSSDESPLGIEGLNGQLNISGRRVDIAQLTGTAGGGTVSLRGFMNYGAQSSFNVSLQGTSVRLRYPEGLRSVLDCNLQLAGNAAASNLTGRVIVNRLSFTQQFDLSNFTAQFNSRDSTPSTSPFLQDTRVNVAVQTSQDVNLASSRVSMQGDANLNVTGTLADPVILGRMTLNGGEIFFLGKRFDMQSGGSIEFVNPVRTEPVLNLYVKTTVQQYDITLNFIGPADRLRTSYTSDPALPTSDIISLLTTGQTAEESATNNTAASTSAESVVASGVAGQFSGQIQKLAGISQLTIDPLAASSNTADPASQVTIQQRVTGNILVTFSTDVTSTQATTVQLQYRTSKQTSVTVLRDQNGGYAVSLRIHKTF